MEWYEEEVHDLEKKLKRSRLPEAPVAFYGSSSIRLWTELSTDLEDDRAVNAGFGGSTLAACVYFFDRIIPPIKPASLVVYAGDNDLGDGRLPEDVLASFSQLVARIDRAEPVIPFGFISIKTSPSRIGLADRIRKTNELIRTAIAAVAGGYYIDLSKALLDRQGRPRPEFFQEDGLHLSRAGYRAWTRALEPYRNRIFTPLLSGAAKDKLLSSSGES